MPIDLLEDAKAIHEAMLRAAFNITILDMMGGGPFTIEAVRAKLPGNAKKFFRNWSPEQTEINAKTCIDLAFSELAEQHGIRSQFVDFFRMGFVGKEIESLEMDHALENTEDSEEARKAFDSGREAACVRGGS